MAQSGSGVTSVDAALFSQLMEQVWRLGWLRTQGDYMPMLPSMGLV